MTLDQKVWSQGGRGLHLGSGGESSGEDDLEAVRIEAVWLQTSESPSVNQLLSFKGHQPCTRIINLLSKLYVTDKEATRQAYVSGMVCVFNLKAVKELVRPREAPWFDFQIASKPHTHWFLWSFMENTSHLALQTG